jgi:hypothetical protein
MPREGPARPAGNVRKQGRAADAHSDHTADEAHLELPHGVRALIPILSHPCGQLVKVLLHSTVRLNLIPVVFLVLCGCSANAFEFSHQILNLLRTRAGRGGLASDACSETPRRVRKCAQLRHSLLQSVSLLARCVPLSRQACDLLAQLRHFGRRRGSGDGWLPGMRPQAHRCPWHRGRGRQRVPLSETNVAVIGLSWPARKHSHEGGGRVDKAVFEHCRPVQSNKLGRANLSTKLGGHCLQFSVE